MFAFWAVFAFLARPPVRAPRGVGLTSGPLHVVQLAEEAQIPQFVRPPGVYVVHMIAGCATVDAAAHVAGNDEFPYGRPV